HVVSPALVPEIRLHLAAESIPLWQKTEEELGVLGLPPPFWAFAWAGGQALARYVLDHRDIVRGLSIIDLGAGSGLIGISAAIAGAKAVMAADIDAFACAAMKLNFAINDVGVVVSGDDLLEEPPPRCDLILVGDLFYEKSLAERVLVWLLRAEQQGIEVLI